MDASTVVAICATVIAVGSLVVSVSEPRATRQHYRLTVRPLLELDIHYTLAARWIFTSSTLASARRASRGPS